MSTDDKPVQATDPVVVTPPTSDDEAIRQRMEEERQKQAAIHAPAAGGTADVTTQGSPSNNDEAIVATLKVLEASTGRKFKDIDDFKSHYTGLNSLVGDATLAKAREAAAVLDKWEKQFGKAPAELEKFLADTAIAATQQPAQTQQTQQAQPQAPVVKTEPVVTKADDATVQRIEKLEHDNQLLALEKKYPNAMKVANEVAVLAKAEGISYVEAFEKSPLKELVELKAKEEQQRSPVVTPSNRTNVDNNVVNTLGKKILSGTATQADREKLVAEMTGNK